MVKRGQARNRWLEPFSHVASPIIAKVRLPDFTASDGTTPKINELESVGFAQTPILKT